MHGEVRQTDTHTDTHTETGTQRRWRDTSHQGSHSIAVTSIRPRPVPPTPLFSWLYVAKAGQPMELQYDDGWWQVKEALTPHTRLSTGHAQRAPPPAWCTGRQEDPYTRNTQTDTQRRWRDTSNQGSHSISVTCVRLWPVPPNPLFSWLYIAKVG